MFILKTIRINKNSHLEIICKFITLMDNENKMRKPGTFHILTKKDKHACRSHFSCSFKIFLMPWTLQKQEMVSKLNLKLKWYQTREIQLYYQNM
jgi:hypothetical protein